jgi:hypothetical protein
LKQSLEDKKAMAMEAAKKAKSKGSKKKKTDDEINDNEPAAMEDEEYKQEENFNLENKEDFNKALKARIKMPFLFGPVEFTGLNSNEDNDAFDYMLERENVINILQRSSFLPQNICVHGFRVKIKQRNLKRRSSLLKHSRFMRNMEVTPNPPPIKEEEKEENEEEPEEDD